MYFRRVFVGLNLELRDLTSEEFVPAAARRLVERGIEIAVAQRGELHLCAVIDGLDLTQIPVSPQQITVFGGILSERLDSLAEEAREAGVECETSLLGGVAWQELLQQADEWSADLIVIGAGSQHPSGFQNPEDQHDAPASGRFSGNDDHSLTRRAGFAVATSRLGPTALRLLRLAKCPVLVERPEASDDEGEPPHVLLADDLSDGSGERLMAIVGSGLWRDAKCWLTHIVEPDRWPEAWQGGISTDDLARRQAARVESARLKLHEHLAPTDHRTMSYGILTHVADGEFSATLRRLIDEWQINLLICGSGSQMDAVLPHVSCSVLCFSSPDAYVRTMG